ncbi:MAG: urease accessory protein UreD [Moraxellaceae bacterium]|nr:urease accessory protein UreD [Moraxellaceae bacterium]
MIPVESALAAAHAQQNQHSHAHGWRARLTLRTEDRAGRSALMRREHIGPLRVQKALYPEGDAVCQVLVLHPPAGIAGGDELELDIAAGAGSHLQLTTPGAGKWYRSIGPWAHQRIHLTAEAGARLEWLPQETILFDEALAHQRIDISLASSARAMGWDILCIGRQARGERFTRGTLRQGLDLRVDSRLLWTERGSLQGSDALLAADVALAGCTVSGTFWMYAEGLNRALLDSLREEAFAEGQAGITMPAGPDKGLVVARAIGDKAESLRHYFTRLWQRARPVVIGREALAPRIWST